MTYDNFDAQELLNSPDIGYILAQIEILDDIDDVRLLLFTARSNGNVEDIINALEEKKQVIENA